MFFYASKGSPVLAKEGRSNIFQFPPVSPGNKMHPTERPLEMISEVITTFAFEGSKVLVPFAGSGNTLIAAALNKMMPIGYDLTEEYRNSYVLKCEKYFGGGQDAC
jgi:site-specific DNA-methyltransferase (adenine-specific)